MASNSLTFPGALLQCVCVCVCVFVPAIAKDAKSWPLFKQGASCEDCAVDPVELPESDVLSSMQASLLQVLLQAAVARQAESSGSQVTIVMADSRIVLPEDEDMPTKPADASWMTLTAALNLQYAKQHGYNFMFLQYMGDCILDQNGSKVKRHPAWCKLLAIQHASQAHKDTIVGWMDTDAIFANQSITVESFLQNSTLYIPGVNPLVNSSLPVKLSKDDCNVYTLKDKYPEYNHYYNASRDAANTGMQFWPQPLNRNLLSTWWRTNMSFDHWAWEQDAFNYGVIPQHPRETCVIDNANYCRQSLPDFVWHHCRCRAGWVPMEELFPAIFPNISHSNFEELMYELRDHIVNMPQYALDALAASL